MYQYPQLKKIKQINSNILVYEIYITIAKWKELLVNPYLRFFYSKKNILYELQKENTLHTIKLCEWHRDYLIKDYKFSKKYRHLNLIQHECYFEYEEDIIHYLCNDNDDLLPNDINEYNAVLITPKYDDINNINELSLYIRQIIFCLCHLYFTHHISFSDINLENIYVNKNDKIKNIIYNIKNKKHNIKTSKIVKINNFFNIIENCECLEKLYDNIRIVLKQFQSRYNYDITNIEKQLNSSENDFLIFIENF